MPWKNNWNAGDTVAHTDLNTLAGIVNGVEGAYHKPSNGITESDLSSSVQTKLNATGGGTGGGTPSNIKRGTISGIGDSALEVCAKYLPSLGSSSNLHLPEDFIYFANMLAGFPFEFVGVCAGSGYTLQQIVTTHLQPLLDLAPEYAFIWTGIGNGGMLPGGTDFSPSLLREFESTLIDPIDDAGIKPILVSFLPAANSTNTGLSQAEIERYNVWGADLASRRGFFYLDLYAALIDPATGTYKAGFTSDNLHPDADGAAAMIPMLRDFLKALGGNSTRFSLAAYNTTIAGRAPNPLLPHSSGLPTGWNPYTPGNGTYSTAAAPNGKPGNRLQVAHGTSGANGAMYMYGPTIDVAAGNKFEFGCLLDFNGIGGLYLGIVDQNGSANGMPAIGTTGESFPLVINQTLCYMRGKVPSGVTKLQPVLGTVNTAGCIAGLSQYTLRNLTTLNI